MKNQTGQQIPRFRAVIFDLDGVLAETETVSFQILKKYIEPHSVDWDDYEKLIGKGSKSFAEWLKTHFDFEGTVDEIQNNANTFRVEQIEQMHVPEMPGASELLESLKERHVKLAVASQSDIRWVRSVLQTSDLLEYFDSIVTSDEVDKPKPAPDIYLKAAKILETPISDCLAFEDSLIGIDSAINAGIFTIQLRQSTPPPPFAETANLVVDSFPEFMQLAKLKASN